MIRLLAAVLIVGLGLFAATGALKRSMLYPFNPNHRPPPSGLTETRLATADGETLVIWSARPTPGKATVLYFHGNAGNLAVRASRFEALTRRGFGLVAAGYRGSSGSTGRPGEPALIGDARALAEARPDLTGPGSVVYYGESLGSAVAIALAETYAPGALVLEAPFASLADMSAHLYGTAALARLLRAKWPSRDRIAEVSAPLLVLHGENDRLVPVAQGRAVLAAASSTDKTFYAVPDAGHVDVWQPEAQRRLFAFLDRF